MSGKASIDASELLPLFKALQGVDAELRRNTNKRLRQAAGECARGLVGELRRAASSSPTPQARIVAKTVGVASDRVPAVKVGGSRGVGHRKTPAGRLLWGSEHGGRTFSAPPGGPYWIDPTVKAYNAGPAPGVYLRAVVSILSDAKVL